MNQLDARGLTSPMPLIRLKKVLQEAGYVGQWRVLVDNEREQEDIVHYLQVEGVAYKSSSQAEGTVLTFNLEKDRIHRYDSFIADYVLAIDSDLMGRGEDELGRTLLRSFINSLEHQQALPEKILLYNKGVLMSRSGTDTGDSLARLEALGVKIFLCGTCLDYFDLSNGHSCGQVVNLMTIAHYMIQAKRIVKP